MSDFGRWCSPGSRVLGFAVGDSWLRSQCAICGGLPCSRLFRCCAGSGEHRSDSALATPALDTWRSLAGVGPIQFACTARDTGDVLVARIAVVRGAGVGPKSVREKRAKLARGSSSFFAVGPSTGKTAVRRVVCECLRGYAWHGIHASFAR